MPIITQCSKCGKKLRSPDAQVGREAKCPGCKQPFLIKVFELGANESDSASSDASSHPRTPSQRDSEEWYVLTNDGTKYGPATRQELDGWMADGRIDETDKIFQQGWEQWKPAADVYSELRVSEASKTDGSTSVNAIADGESQRKAAIDQLKQTRFPLYLRRHYRQCHLPGFVGVLVGAIGAVGLSWMKPVIGYQALCGVIASCFALAVVSAVIYLIERIYAFFVLDERDFSKRTRNWFAVLGHLCFLAIIPMAVMMIAEYFAPASGLARVVVQWLRG